MKVCHMQESALHTLGPGSTLCQEGHYSLELKVVEMNLLTGTAVLAQEGVRLIDSKQLAPNQRPDGPVTVQQEGKKGSANMQC